MKYICQIKTGPGSHDVHILCSFVSNHMILKDDWFSLKGMYQLEFYEGFKEDEETRNSYIYTVLAREMAGTDIILFVSFIQDHSYLADIFSQ